MELQLYLKISTYLVYLRTEAVQRKSQIPNETKNLQHTCGTNLTLAAMVV